MKSLGILIHTDHIVFDWTKRECSLHGNEMFTLKLDLLPVAAEFIFNHAKTILDVESNKSVLVFATPCDDVNLPCLQDVTQLDPNPC